MNSGMKSGNQGALYKIHTWIYTGLSHGEGVSHYSLRAVKQLIDKSKLKSASLTMTVTTGREDGTEEDTVVIEGIWPPGDIQALAQKCEAVNDFLRLVFTELHQRWLIFRFTTTTADGSPLKIDKIDLDPKNRPTIEVSDLILQGSAGRPILRPLPANGLSPYAADAGETSIERHLIPKGKSERLRIEKEEDFFRR